ncbi:Diphthamide synthase [Fragilaria crotonensis]|nr:Diphthamide synthase [Fragilaria crotonensis]
MSPSHKNVSASGSNDICVELGLTLVGVTHECDHDDSSILRLTKDGLKPNSSQGEIHDQIQTATIQANSLYPVLEDVWKSANPNIVLTQDLCAVCGPTSTDACALDKAVQTVSLSPSNLEEVAATFVTVAEACNVRERGQKLKDKFWSQLRLIQAIVEEIAPLPRPKILLLEWLDPPFDGGHWIPEMIVYAGAVSAIAKKGVKSVSMTWQQVYDSKPDIVIVACCGFDLERNRKDALEYGRTYLTKLDPTTRIYAADGNQFFARPGPKLTGGVAILAQIAYPGAAASIAALDFAPQRGDGWDRIYLNNNMDDDRRRDVPDVEDLGCVLYAQIHKEACLRGEHQYKDPTSGYNVFTEIAHKARGKCCGSGCRHCPYNHENVKDKAALIKEPSFLHQAVDMEHPIKVLFFSGGKDSFLAIRALVRQAYPSEIVLLTTFDAISRVVANQEIPIQLIERQAKHLDLSLVCIPMHRASGIDYIDRLRAGMSLIERTYGRSISSLVFGDLHLEHIRSWREQRVGELGYKLEFPLWHVSYDDLLKDLEKSMVPCVVSASTVNSVAVGTLFTKSFSESLRRNGDIDGFGENGEFHSLAQVWEVDRRIALALQE